MFRLMETIGGDVFKKNYIPKYHNFVTLLFPLL